VSTKSKSTTSSSTYSEVNTTTNTSSVSTVGDIGLTGTDFVQALDTLATMGVMVTDTLSDNLISTGVAQSAVVGNIASQNVGQTRETQELTRQQGENVILIAAIAVAGVVLIGGLMYLGRKK